MVRRPVAWVVAVVLFCEALFVAALNWFLGMVVDRQYMFLAGLAPGTMAMSSKIGGVVFGLYFALCGLIALLVALRDRAPSGLGRALLISVAVVQGLLGAFAWGLVGRSAFLLMVVVLALVVLLLMTYDERPGTASSAGGDAPGAGGAPEAADGPGAVAEEPWAGSGGSGGSGTQRSRGGAVEPRDDILATAAPGVTPRVSTTP
ncbi:hypothetical protein [Streptomyces sp. NPDC001508]|uniref:hypothetical protein n=1 Tax=Streptomyces sp. NPDC001508 TaxID=3154656 RepID=UPI00332EAB33